MAFTSVVTAAAGVVKGDCGCTLPLGGVGPTGLGALLCIIVGKDPVANTEGRLEGNVDPSKGLDVKVAELVDIGNTGDGYSGKFGVDAFDAPLDKDALKLGYCIGGCNGGIPNPCGGRGNDC